MKSELLACSIQDVSLFSRKKVLLDSLLKTTSNYTVNFQTIKLKLAVASDAVGKKRFVTVF